MRAPDSTRRHTAPHVDTDTVLGKVVTVSFAFSAEDHGVSAAELGRRTGLAKWTLHRLVADLVQARSQWAPTIGSGIARVTQS